MNIDVFLQRKFIENELSEVVKTIDLYEDISNNNLKNLFAIMHHKFNSLFSFLSYKQQSNGHYNADESRALLSTIKLYEDMQYVLKNTPYSFKINDDYKGLIMKCKTFLVESGGSAIPEDTPTIDILEYDPIFELSQTIQKETSSNTVSYQIKQIGEGSYAKVFKYKDEFYNKYFVIKRANDNLDGKELARFKKEFEIMNSLHSPYIVEVYRYDCDKNEYYMELADESLYSYISKNNTKLSISERKNIVGQILRAFQYIHSKDILHRDISLTNILIFNYDDTHIVKIADFGLVKEALSNLTSINSEVKGSLNDSNLHLVGFSNYSIEYETFALTRLIYYVMTGRTNISNEKNPRVLKFLERGFNSDISKRYQNIQDLKTAFNTAF